MAIVIIPHEYIVDGDGKDKAIDTKSIDSVSAAHDEIEDITVIDNGFGDYIRVNLTVPEVCILIADALSGRPPLHFNPFKGGKK